MTQETNKDNSIESLEGGGLLDYTPNTRKQVLGKPAEQSLAPTEESLENNLFNPIITPQEEPVAVEGAVSTSWKDKIQEIYREIREKNPVFRDTKTEASISSSGPVQGSEEYEKA